MNCGPVKGLGNYSLINCLPARQSERAAVELTPPRTFSCALFLLEWQMLMD